MNKEKACLLFAVCLSLFAFNISAGAATLKPENVKCPLRGENFKVLKMPVPEDTPGTDTDLLNRCCGYSPLFFRIWTCPYDGFSAYGDDFSKIKNIPPEVGENLIVPDIPTNADVSEYSQHLIPFWVKIENAALYYDAIGKDAEFMGRLFLLGSWLARMEQPNVEMESSAEAYTCFLDKIKVHEGEFKDQGNLPLWKGYFLIGEAIEKCAAEKGTITDKEIIIAAESFRTAGDHVRCSKWLDMLKNNDNPRVQEEVKNIRFLVAKEKEYQTKAAEYFERIVKDIKAEDKLENREFDLLYLAGEENRRIGEYDKAKRYLGEAARRTDKNDRKKQIETLLETMDNTSIPVGISVLPVEPDAEMENFLLFGFDLNRDTMVKYIPGTGKFAVVSNRVILFDVENDRLVANEKTVFPVIKSAVSGNGKYLAFLYTFIHQERINTAVRVMDLETGETGVNKVFTDSTPIELLGGEVELSLSYDGKLLALGGLYSMDITEIPEDFNMNFEDHIRILRTDKMSEYHTMKPNLSGSTLNALAFGTNEYELFSGGADKAIKVWDATKGEALRLKKAGDHVYSIAISRDNTLFALGERERIEIYSMKTGALKKKFEKPELPMPIDKLAFSPDGKTLAANKYCAGSGSTFALISTDDASPCGKIIAVDVDTGAILKQETGHEAIGDISFSADSRYIVTSDMRDGTLKFWDARTHS
ncbi:MAG TPA: DUF2225 domain-containing protein [bacterium]|nr:DUF2225 domain-containing protein [bacterium]